MAILMNELCMLMCVPMFAQLDFYDVIDQSIRAMRLSTSMTFLDDV